MRFPVAFDEDYKPLDKDLSRRKLNRVLHCSKRAFFAIYYLVLTSNNYYVPIVFL